MMPNTPNNTNAVGRKVRQLSFPPPLVAAAAEPPTVNLAACTALILCAQPGAG